MEQKRKKERKRQKGKKRKKEKEEETKGGKEERERREEDRKNVRSKDLCGALWVCGGEMAESGPMGGGGMGNQQCTKMFVGGLTPNTNEEALVNHFSMFGPVLEATIMLDKQTQQPRGFGFVTFQNPLYI